MLGLDIGTSKLASLVPCKEDDASSLFCITFKHNYRRLSTLSVVVGPGDSVERHRRSRGSVHLFFIAETARTEKQMRDYALHRSKSTRESGAGLRAGR